MTQEIYALDLTYEEWVDLCTNRLGLPRYRADQICSWIYEKKVFSVHEMTNLPKDLREKLAYELHILPPIPVREEKSKDGTRKFLWQLYDGERIESVLLSHGNHTTACLSSQVGCPLACAFCATGDSGYTRDLTAGEMTGQTLAIVEAMKMMNEITAPAPGVITEVLAANGTQVEYDQPLFRISTSANA